MYQEAEHVQTRRRQADTAIQLAMENRWEEAATVNRAILSLFPNDIDSLNRLGKALMELGRYTEAKKPYKRALELDMTNQIAKKNLERLNVLAKARLPQAETTLVDPGLFIEEMGKTAVTNLQQVSKEALTKLNAGERVEFRPKGNGLIVETPGGEFVGTVESKLAHRILKLLQAGNQYAAAITSLTKDQCKVIIKESYQHPSQAGRPSFPAVGAEAVRPYTKESLLRYGLEEEEEAEEAETREEWEAEPEAEVEGRSGDIGLEDYQRVAEGGDRDDEYEE